MTGLLGGLAQDRPRGVVGKSGVEERGIQVDGVVVAVSLLADPEHPGPSQVSDDAPDTASSQAHSLGDIGDAAVRVGRNVEENNPVTGKDMAPDSYRHIESPEKKTTVRGEELQRDEYGQSKSAPGSDVRAGVRR